ncbi:MAG: VacB/RNase II family 3'-5' exoribonuclease [Gammaproteobacteria bacterium]|nr:VacB/RNase II family 3'-5' exoribonuclease [Gammaproteobacteria bacterium]
MKKATKARIRRILRKSGPTPYGKLVGLLRNADGISVQLKTMVRHGELTKDSHGRYVLVNGQKPASNFSDEVTGIVVKESNRWKLQPLDPSERFSITLEPTNDLQNGDIATVKVSRSTQHTVRGSVQEILTADNESARAAIALLRAYKVPHQQAFHCSAKALPRNVDVAGVPNRKDLRSTPFVTIDGESARDFDDAVFGERCGEGSWRLCVAIADVAHYVKAGEPIDVEARSRGNSVYLPDRVVPMLPHELSNGICSLKPNEARLAVVCDMRLDSQGVIDSYEFYEATIQSFGRLTYTEAVQITNGELAGRSDAINQSLRDLYEIYLLLRQRRELRGALDFTERESVVHIVNGTPTDVIVHQRNEAHCLIEESMIAANVCAAKFLQDRNRSPLYRVHDGPDAKSLSELKHDLRASSLESGLLQGHTSREMQQLLETIRSTTSTPWIWELQVLRSMTQAVYSFQNNGHFGLALDEYVHFTSPIRRYADLLVHRLIKSVLHKEGDVSGNKNLAEDIGSELSFCERRATDVTRRVDAWLKCALLSKRIGKVFRGYIVRLEDFGIFVELDSFFISGMVHVSQLKDDYYELNGSELVGVATGTTYKIGDVMKVRLVAVDVEQCKLDLIDATQSEIGHEFRKGKLKFKRQRRDR